jgi:hypothetical protein
MVKRGKRRKRVVQKPKRPLKYLKPLRLKDKCHPALIRKRLQAQDRKVGAYHFIKRHAEGNNNIRLKRS